MVLDLFWTKQTHEPSPSTQQGSLQQRLERLLQKREGRPVPVQERKPLPQSRNGAERLSSSESYLFRTPN